MDVKHGHCWRCEKFISGRPVNCKECWIAVYCSEACRFDDVFRHSVPECEEWGPKQCSNSKCKDVGTAGKFLECSACVNTWYCGRQCQEEDWIHHRESCRKQSQDIEQQSKGILGTLAIKRRRPMPYPYYIGNAIAVDMLNLENNECKDIDVGDKDHPALKKDYSIMSVGCGNLRNFIHTLASLPFGFQGRLHTTLNDHDPFIQARNVLFLFMMIVHADKPGIAGIVTTIWYSLHLSQAHYDFLTDCLRTLTQISMSRLAKLTGMLDISKRDLSLIKKVWRKWLSLECNRRHPSYINLWKQRQKLVQSENNVTRLIDEYKRELDSKYAESFEEWVKHGVFLGSKAARKRYLEYGNPTLTGYCFINYANVEGVDATAMHPNAQVFKDVNSFFRHPETYDFIYCVPPDLHPFGTWDHLLVRKFCRTTRDNLIDMYYSYVTDQIQTAVTTLQRVFQTIFISVSECTDLAASLQYSGAISQYDRIFTSNIADYIGTQELLATFKKFLNTRNKYATIVTQYWNWYLSAPYANINHPNVAVDVLGSLLDMPQVGLPLFIRADFETIMISRLLAINRALIDTGKRTRFKGHYQEYFNSTSHFVRYLRADFSVCLGQRLATFHDVKESSGLGLRMRDFRKELNTVVPFQYRCNVRQVNMLRGQMAHMVEWHVPSILKSFSGAEVRSEQ